jgi:RecA/RadA recombinase
MSKLKAKILKNSTIEFTSELLESKFYGQKDMITTSVPMMNVALAGYFEGGLIPGITMLAGQSKNFKTGFSLLLASAFLQKYPDGMIIFYDSEAGCPISYFKKLNVPMESVIHCPVKDVDMLIFDIMKQLNGLDREDHVLVIIDSIGNLPSAKEVEDTLKGKSIVDMTRSKRLKALFRQITPNLTEKDIPLVVVNHTYKEIGGSGHVPKDIVSGGTGGFYSADTIWIIGRQQETEGEGKDRELLGWNFIINVEKSRFVKEKSKIPITVTYDHGVHKWSGMFDVALESGHIIVPKQGWYNLPNAPEGTSNFRRKAVENDDEFWAKMLSETNFPQWVEKRYRLV